MNQDRSSNSIPIDYHPSLNLQIESKDNRVFDESATQYRYSSNRLRNQRKNPKGNYDQPNIEQLKRISEFKNNTVEAFIDKTSKKKQFICEANDMPIYFPFKPYALQITYMSKVVQALQKAQNAILQSPTGTGKTLCLLASILSWVYKQKLQGRHRKIIYLSRTHSQLQQTERQLKKTCFRPTMSHMGSRDRLCVKPELEGLNGRQKMDSCSKGVNLRKKDLEGLIKWGKMGQQQRKQVKKAMCTYYQQRSQTINMGKNLFTNKLFEMQEFVNYGKNEHFCPYYYPFHMDQYCDLIFMPYNYILDVDILPRFDEMIKDGILIFDEAHNVPQASCQGRSNQIFSYNFDGAQGELQKILFATNLSEQLKSIKEKYKKDIHQILKYFLDVKQTIKHYIHNINLEKFPNHDEKLYEGQQNEVIKTFNTQDMYLALYEMIKGVMLNKENRQLFACRGDYFRKCMNSMVNQISSNCSKINSLAKELKQTTDGTCNNMEKMSIFLKKAAVLISDSILAKKDFIQTEINHFCLVLKIQLQPKGKNIKSFKIKRFSLQLRCLVPWLTFQSIKQLNPHSMIFTSGTLQPLEIWQDELNLDIPIKLTNTHVVTEKQVSLNILCKNIEENPFDFRFKSLNQNRGTIFDELVQSIFQITKNVPNGVLVVCPNYRTLNELKIHINQQKYRQKMNKLKKQIFQERNSDKYIDKFKKESELGAVLYCVCRGKASEGIDFPDHHCRAVIFIGVPFPNVHDPILVERKQHFDKLHRHRHFLVQHKEKFRGITWEKWYFNNTIRAINQSLGRLIRHVKDYGMLFLLDQRYDQPRFKNAMPKWTQRSVSVWQQFTYKRIDSIEQFYIHNESILS